MWVPDPENKSFVGACRKQSRVLCNDTQERKSNPEEGYGAKLGVA
jgi:hypothetical protein